MAVGVQIVGIAPSDNSGYTPTGGSQVDFTPGGQLIVDCILTLTGNYGGGATHGDTINFGTTVAGSLDFPSGQAPSWWDFHELVVAGAAASGFVFDYHPGPTLAAPTQNGGVLYITGGATASQDGLNEIAEGGAYSGTTPSLNNVQIRARFWFQRGV